MPSLEQNVEYALWNQRFELAAGEGGQRRLFREFRETRAHELAGLATRRPLRGRD